MDKILGIARYTFTEVFRNRVYYTLLLFAAILIGATLLLGDLAGEQRARLLGDLGFATIEVFGLLIAVFSSVTLILEEMESRTLYLILSRPVSRYQFIVGRFLGLCCLITVAMTLMGAMLAFLLKSQHAWPAQSFILVLGSSWLKIMMVTAMGIFFSLFATSTVSALVFTLFFWVLGHCSQEVEFLARKSGTPGLATLSKLFYCVAPNFALINWKDIAAIDWPSRTILIQGVGYGFLYTAGCLFFASLLFDRKEF